MFLQHYCTLHQTGQGVQLGTDVDNLCTAILREFPWYDDLYAIWNGIPNFTTKLMNSQPGQPHGGNFLKLIVPNKKISPAVQSHASPPAAGAGASTSATTVSLDTISTATPAPLAAAAAATAAVVPVSAWHDADDVDFDMGWNSDDGLGVDEESVPSGNHNKESITTIQKGKQKVKCRLVAFDDANSYPRLYHLLRCSISTSTLISTLTLIQIMYHL